MIKKWGHSLYETVDKVPEIGDTWENKPIVGVYEIYPMLYEVELSDGSCCYVEVV